jgi:DeoR/GlpR family transcriptional regulator of sugar metabolism
MLTRQRKQEILERLRSHGQIVAKDLSREWQVSEDTIRRDLRELAREGHLQRVHGGALPASRALGDLKLRAELAPDEKRAIAEAAVELIEPGQVLFFDGGTTTLALAQALPADLPVTVVTHSPAIAVALNVHPRIEVVLLGGRMFKHSGVTMGAATLDAIRAIRADAYFLGVTGVHPELGLTTGDLEEAHIKRALIESAAEVVLMATADKIGRGSPYVIAPASALTSLLTSEAADADVLAALRKLDIEVHCVAA